MVDENRILVSIECCVYNHEPYLRQCLEGIVMQKTNFPFEAVVHDDASTDSSAAIILEYAKKYPDIIKPIIEEENQYSKHDGSLRKVLNAHLSGKYIAWCEGDDYWCDIFKLQTQVDYLEEHPECSLCFHNAVEFEDDNQRAPHIFNKLSYDQDVSFEDFTSRWIIPSASIVYRKDMMNYPDWSNKIYSGDMTLALMCFNNGTLHYINRVMSFYRRQSLSLSHNVNGVKSLEHQIALFAFFNQETKGKFDKQCKKVISNKRQNVKYYYWKHRGRFLPLLMMPIYCFKRMLTIIKEGR